MDNENKWVSYTGGESKKSDGSQDRPYFDYDHNIQTELTVYLGKMDDGRIIMYLLEYLGDDEYKLAYMSRFDNQKHVEEIFEEDMRVVGKKIKENIKKISTSKDSSEFYQSLKLKI